MKAMLVILMLGCGIIMPAFIQAEESVILVVNADENITTTSTTTTTERHIREFIIDYERDTFLMDGKPFRFVAGSFHYFRAPHQYWRDRLRAMRAAGLNAVTTYVEWSFHEPEWRQYHWTGDRDIAKFIEIAQEEDLYVILRPGPYICAERDLGGFPYWLITKYPGIKLRTSDEDYKSEVTGWYDQLMKRLYRFFYGNGGPIIMIQVENEYGSYEACDKRYMSWLAQLTETWSRGAAVLFTTDGNGENYLKCGTTPGVYPTIDFGPSTNVTAAWEVMRKYAPRGPLVNSEFYPGWLTHWGEKMAYVGKELVVKSLKKQLDTNGNVNFYMFYGGTNFGYTAGADLNEKYEPDITSYDYDAPLSEAGDITPKYLRIRETLLNYFPPPPTPLPVSPPKLALGKITLNPVLALLSEDGRRRFGGTPQMSTLPLTMEDMGQGSGMLLYEAKLPERRPDPSGVTVDDLKDRALVYVDGTLVGGLSRSRKLSTFPLLAAQGNNLQLLVENQGRINYGAMDGDLKGLSSVKIESFVVRNWTMTSFLLSTVENGLEGVEGVAPLARDTLIYVKRQLGVATAGFLKNGPVFYVKKFRLNEDQDPLDTYLDVTGWGKGVAWINDWNLGRYWPDEGPQVTIYTPGVYLKKYPAENMIVLLELEKAPKNLQISFIDTPNLVNNPTIFKRQFTINQTTL